MKKQLFILALAVLMTLPTPCLAASLTNEDKQVHQVKGRKPGKGWVYIEINPSGTKYFNCRFGCELVLEKTGSAVELEEDADVVIKNGVLIVK